MGGKGQVSRFGKRRGEISYTKNRRKKKKEKWGGRVEAILFEGKIRILEELKCLSGRNGWAYRKKKSNRCVNGRGDGFSRCWGEGCRSRPFGKRVRRTRGIPPPANGVLEKQRVRMKGGSKPGNRERGEAQGALNPALPVGREKDLLAMTLASEVEWRTDCFILERGEGEERRDKQERGDSGGKQLIKTPDTPTTKKKTKKTPTQPHTKKTRPKKKKKKK